MIGNNVRRGLSAPADMPKKSMLDMITCVRGQDVERRGTCQTPSMSSFPPDAVAVIYRPARSAMTSGLANTRRWKLRFERRSAPFIEPLMGWTGGDDTLAQVELTFQSADEAVAYARRQGLKFVVHGLEDAKMAKPRRDSSPSCRDPNGMAGTLPRPEWVERTLGWDAVGDAPAIDRALVNPSACFARPEDVLRDPKLARDEKRDILRRWALDAYLVEVAATEGAPSRLEEVIDALIDLDDAEKLAPKATQARSAQADQAAKAAA
jgi:hypothetical protein